jgi:hypothetical protein
MSEPFVFVTLPVTKTCTICKKFFTATSRVQKTCLSRECQRELHAGHTARSKDRIERRKRMAALK